MSSWQRNISFATSLADYNLLEDVNIVKSISRRIYDNDDAESITNTEAFIADGRLQNFYFEIFLSVDDIITINGDDPNPTIITIYSSENYISSPVTSIVIDNSGLAAITGTFSFDMI